MIKSLVPVLPIVVSYFACFLCGLAPLREPTTLAQGISRKDAKSQRIAKPDKTPTHFGDFTAKKCWRRDRLAPDGT